MLLYSNNSPDNLNTVNKKVTTFLNIQNGDLAVSLEVKKFKFRENIHEQDFNTKYLESDKFPKITFKGNIGDCAKLDFTKSDIYPIKAKGELTIHGITRHVELKGTIKKLKEKYQLQTLFVIFMNDYKIVIPKEIGGYTKEILQAEMFFELLPKN